jgi:phosphopantothenate--cysteine ligase
MRILITSGGTKVPIDRVRHIANMSSGTFGSKIALEALKENHSVLFFKAERSKSPFFLQTDVSREDSKARFEEMSSNYEKYKGCYSEVEFSDFESYLRLLQQLTRSYVPDIIILAAAVSDYGVSNYVDGKIRTKGNQEIKLKPLPKVISMVNKWMPNACLVGFKLLVDSTDEELIANAKKSLVENHCDLVVANDLRDIKKNDHRLLIVKSRDRVVEYKTDVKQPNALALSVVKEAIAALIEKDTF